VPGAEHIDRLGAWTGYRAGTVQRFEAGVHGPEPEVWIELQPRPDRVKVCDGCGQACHRVHDTAERWVRDLPVFDARTRLLVHRCRLACPRCGPRLDWLGRHARVTARLAESVARLCGVLPIKHVAEHDGLGWDAVKEIHKAHLEKTLGEPDLDGLEVLAMDEFALHKGHRYATVVIDPTCKRVLWVGVGRDRASIRPFFEMLGPERCGKIRAVALDMSSAHELEVKAHCPGAEIVFDFFHVVAKYGREVIDRVRVDEANRVRADRKERRVVKSARCTPACWRGSTTRSRSSSGWPTATGTRTTSSSESGPRSREPIPKIPDEPNFGTGAADHAASPELCFSSRVTPSARPPRLARSPGARSGSWCSPRRPPPGMARPSREGGCRMPTVTDKKAQDLAGPGIGNYTDLEKTPPTDCASLLDVLETPYHPALSAQRREPAFDRDACSAQRRSSWLHDSQQRK